MTSPEPPDMDRLREVVTEAIDAVIDGWMQGDPWPDEERLADAVLAALLPVHRAMVLGEAADALTEAGRDPLRNAAWMYADEAAVLVRHFAASTPPGAPGSPQTAERAAAVPGTGDDQAACDRCRRRFDPDDKDPAGAARYAESKFCRGCVDRCHESTDAFHECPVCAS